MISIQGYPLRPELAESTFLLHAATGDAAYLAAGRELQVRRHCNILTRTPAGLTPPSGAGHHDDAFDCVSLEARAYYIP